jgi:ssDNA-binding Zn-finger/Zn-ribbon topoisomerase 1
MRLRTSGATRRRFWGCGRYPDCRTTQAASAADLALLESGSRVDLDAISDRSYDRRGEDMIVDQSDELSTDDLAPEGLRTFEQNELQDDERS